MTVCQLRARVRGMKRRNAIELLVVDYLQLLASETKRGENREREVAMFSNAIKTLARELEIPILLLCQLNRDLERDKTRKPRLSDLRESGSIEQDADLVGMLYRVPAETEDDNPTAPQPVNLLIAKNRDGEQGEVRLTLLREFTRFESVRPIHE